MSFKLRRLSKKKAQKKLRYFKRHPFVVPVSVFLVLFFVTIGAVIAIGGETIGASDTKVVLLHVDGEEQVVPTRARTVQDLLGRLNIQVSDQDIVEPALDTTITIDNFHVNIFKARSVLVEDEGSKQVIITAEPTPVGVAEKAGLKIYPEDIVEKAPLASEPIEALNEGVVAERVVVERATPVKLSLYGETYTVRTHAGTIGELVEDRGINPTEETVFPAPDKQIKANETIFVTHPGKRIVSIEEEVPQGEEIVSDYDLPAGTREVRSEGRPGKRAVIYEISKDGKTKKALREVILERPVNRVIAQGIQVIINNPSENVKLGESLAANRGWTGSQWLCLYSLWQKESGWSSTAGNPTTGAYGIPQALPGSKMGAGWQSDPVVQINWGLGYIAGRYGTPCGAWSYFQSVGWY